MTKLKQNFKILQAGASVEDTIEKHKDCKLPIIAEIGN